jgi:hypothetical protein
LRFAKGLNQPGTSHTHAEIDQKVPGAAHTGGEKKKTERKTGVREGVLKQNKKTTKKRVPWDTHES